MPSVRLTHSHRRPTRGLGGEATVAEEGLQTRIIPSTMRRATLDKLGSKGGGVLMVVYG